MLPAQEQHTHLGIVWNVLSRDKQRYDDCPQGQYPQLDPKEDAFLRIWGFESIGHQGQHITICKNRPGDPENSIDMSEDETIPGVLWCERYRRQ